MPKHQSNPCIAETWEAARLLPVSSSQREFLEERVRARIRQMFASSKHHARVHALKLAWRYKVELP